MNVRECVEQGLLQNTGPDAAKAGKSLKAAERKLLLARAELENGLFESCMVYAYASMFHAARALLFRDGFKERSHYAVFVYLSEKYSGRIEEKFITEFDQMRMERHNLMYSLDEEQVGEAEAEAATELAKEFIGAVAKLL